MSKDNTDAVKAALAYLTPHPGTKGPVILDPKKLRAAVLAIRERLEIAYAYDGVGNKVPFPAGMEHLDGIAARDETIRGLEGRIAALRAKISASAP